MSSGGQRGKKKRRGGKGRGQQQQQQLDQSESTPGSSVSTREATSDIKIDDSAKTPSTSELKDDASAPGTTAPSHESDKQDDEQESNTAPQEAVEYRKSSVEAPATRNRGKRAKKKAKEKTRVQVGTPTPTTTMPQVSGDHTIEPVKDVPIPIPEVDTMVEQLSIAEVPPTSQVGEQSAKPSGSTPVATSTTNTGRQEPSTHVPDTPKAVQPDHGGAKPKRQTPQPTKPRPPADPQRRDSSTTELKQPIKRPDTGGTIGRPINLFTNCFEIKFKNPEQFYHHYNTNIKLAGSKEWDTGFTKSERPKIIGAMAKQYKRDCPDGPRLVYDQNGKNIFCGEPIPNVGKEREFQVVFTTDHGKERNYIIQIKWVGQVSLRDLVEALQGKRAEIPQNAIQAINTVIGHLPSLTTVRHRSYFYDIPKGAPDLTGGAECWSGRFMSAHAAKWKMVLNVDKCAAGFYKEQPVLQLLCDVLRIHRDRLPHELDAGQHRLFKKAIEGVKIETTHAKRKQKVNKLSDGSARNETFKNDEGEVISVAEYFRKNYRGLQYPGLPCVRLGQRCLIPIELCNVLPQQRKTELTPDQTAAIIRHTAIPAPQRRKQICQLVRDSRFNQDPNCVDFGITVSDKMMEIEERVLPPPQITYGPKNNPVTVTPKDGKWNMQQKAYIPVDIKEWVVVSFAKFLQKEDIKYFFKNLVDDAKRKGNTMHPTPRRFVKLIGVGEIEKTFGAIRKDFPKLQLLFAILPEARDENRKQVLVGSFYEAVKQYGDVQYGMITQCIAAKTVKEKAEDRQTIGNICLKINAKVGGTTSVIAEKVKSKILLEPVIIFGADVTHASLGKFSPSIAAVVASMDLSPNKYSPEIRLQPRGVEIIEDMKDITKSLLYRYKNATNKLPKKIIFFRDGVDEGQFVKVLMAELQGIQRACMEIKVTYKPPITFIVVKKRHHTLFFPKEEKDESGRSKNIPPGTVVDRGVCHPTEFDYYLASHAGIQGTSKSAHYHVLYDDSNFSSNQIQELSHQLCHTYVKCARSVSIPAPIYYAHHVAFRARYHLKKAAGPDGTLPDDSITDEMRKAVKVHKDLENQLYFA